jgi:hypothetical protein
MHVYFHMELLVMICYSYHHLLRYEGEKMRLKEPKHCPLLTHPGHFSLFFFTMGYYEWLALMSSICF